MNMDRRLFIKHLGIGLCMGASVPFIPSLIPDVIGLDKPTKLMSGYALKCEFGDDEKHLFDSMNYVLKELYTDDRLIHIYQEHPMLKLVPKTNIFPIKFDMPFAFETKKP